MVPSFFYSFNQEKKEKKRHLYRLLSEIEEVIYLWMGWVFSYYRQNQNIHLDSCWSCGQLKTNASDLPPFCQIQFSQIFLLVISKLIYLCSQINFIFPKNPRQLLDCATDGISFSVYMLLCLYIIFMFLQNDNVCVILQKEEIASLGAAKHKSQQRHPNW